jgi:hypothetical protein
VILDDDPTGTQAVSDVDVILRPDRAAGRDARVVLRGDSTLRGAERRGARVLVRYANGSPRTAARRWPPTGHRATTGTRPRRSC